MCFFFFLLSSPLVLKDLIMSTGLDDFLGENNERSREEYEVQPTKL
jgi:hypothetical protein